MVSESPGISRPATPSWIDHAIWWQVYPLGFVGAEREALPPGEDPRHRLGRRKLLPVADHRILHPLEVHRIVHMAHEVDVLRREIVASGAIST